MTDKKKPVDHTHTGNCWHALDPHIDICTHHGQPRGECSQCKPCRVCGSDKGWTPRRHHDVYCSPLCGCDCTWEEYQQAKKKAAALAKRLGTGWVPIAHENLGWHYHATDSTGRIKVQERTTTYTASVARRIGGVTNLTAQGDTPEAAVLAGLRQLEEERTYMVRLYNQLRDSCKDAISASHDKVEKKQKGAKKPARR